MRRFGGPPSTTYRSASSGENARPFGRSRSPATTAAAGRGVDAVDVRRKLGGRLVALVEAEDAVGRVREPDRAVGAAHDVVRRVEGLAVEPVGDHGDRAVVLGAGHPARVVLAGDEAALAVSRVPVRVAGGLAEDADRARLLLPLHHPVVRDVAPQEVAPVPEPRGPLAPAEAGAEPLDLGEGELVPGEARVERPDGGVGVALARRPVPERARRGGDRSRGRSRHEELPSVRSHSSPPPTLRRSRPPPVRPRGRPPRSPPAPVPRGSTPRSPRRAAGGGSGVAGDAPPACRRR